jgi:hypothetical protein
MDTFGYRDVLFDGGWLRWRREQRQWQWQWQWRIYTDPHSDKPHKPNGSCDFNALLERQVGYIGRQRHSHGSRWSRGVYS